MKPQDIKIDTMTLVKQRITINVKVIGQKEFRIKRIIVGWVLRMAANIVEVLGFKCEVETSIDPTPVCNIASRPGYHPPPVMKAERPAPLPVAPKPKHSPPRPRLKVEDVWGNRPREWG